MRLLLCAFCLAGFEATVCAEEVIVTGLLTMPDGKPAPGLRVKLYARSLFQTSELSTASGVYTITKRINVDPKVFDVWYVLCENGEYSAYGPVILERKSDTTLQASVDLRLQLTPRGRLDSNQAYKTIRQRILIEAIKVYGGEINLEEGNRQTTIAIGSVFQRTDLGEDPRASTRLMFISLRQTYDTNLPRLEILKEEKFDSVAGWKERQDFEVPKKPKGL
jgi:hypothetical protein